MTIPVRRPLLGSHATNPLVWLLSCAFASTAFGAPLDGPPEYKPETRVTGTIRAWGDDHMASLMKHWEAGFAKFHPNIRFSNTLKGTASAPFGLYEWVADVALMGREMIAVEYYGIFRRAHQYAVGIEVATGAYDAPGKSPALTLFVHKDNPLTRLTLKQLDGIYGTQRDGGWDGLEWSTKRARGAEGNLRTWGQLGLTGEWANRPIHPYGPPGIYPGGISYFQARVLNGSDKASEDLLEFENTDEMMAELGRDPHGIAYASMGHKTSQVKALALASTESGPYVAPTWETVANRTYPLARPVFIYVTTDTQDGAGEPADPKLEPKVKEFLRYVLSRQGQEDVSREGQYLPLSGEVARQQMRLLESPSLGLRTRDKGKAP